MIGGGEREVIVQELSELFGEGRCKLRTAIRDDFIKKSKAKEDFVKKEGGDPFSSDRFLSRAKNYPLSKPMVYHDHERIEACGHGEICDKIAGDLLKRVRGDGFDGGEGGYGGVRVNLVLLAKGTAFDVAADEGGESGPPEFGGNQLSSFQEAGMSGGLVIMAACKNGAAKGIVRGDVDTAFVGEDAGFNLPVSQPGTEGEGNVLVHGLEGLEDKGITCGGRFDAVREGGVDEINKEGWWEEGDIGVVRIVRGEEVRSAGEGIGASKKFSGDMDHFQVEVGKVNEPTCLAAVESLGLTEVGKVFVVGEDLYREGGAMKIVAPRFRSTNDGKEFAVINIVGPFGRREGLREVGAGVPVAVGVSLKEDSARCVFRGVRGDSEGGGEVGEVKDGFGEEKMLEGLKGGLTRRGPVPGKVLLGEVEERAGDVGVVGDESSVEIGKAKERANVFHLGWYGPICDAVEFDGVHGQLAGFNDHAEVFYLVSGELALLEF